MSLILISTSQATLTDLTADQRLSKDISITMELENLQSMQGADKNACSTNTVLSRVRFDRVSIREHAVVIGDNPSCSGGAPVSLGWEYAPDHKEFSIDDYEQVRRGSRRLHCEMKMPVSVRHGMLMDDWHVSMNAILTASRETGAVREERMKTARKALRQQRNKERLQSTCNSLKGIFKRTNKSSNMKPHDVIRELNEKAKEATVDTLGDSCETLDTLASTNSVDDQH